MSTDETTILEFDGDFSALEAKLTKHLPETARDAAKAAAKLMEREVEQIKLTRAMQEVAGVGEVGARKAAVAIQREMDRARKEAEAAARGVAQAWDKSFNAIDRGANKLGIGFVGDMADILEGIEALGPAAGTAAAGGIALGGAFAIAGVEAAALGVAVYGLGSALYGAAESTGRLNDEQVAAKMSFDALQQTIGNDVAPQMETITIAAGGAALALRDGYVAVRDQVREWRDWLGLSPRVERAMLALASNQGLWGAATQLATVEILEQTHALDPLVAKQKAIAAGQAEIAKAQARAAAGAKETSEEDTKRKTEDDAADRARVRAATERQAKAARDEQAAARAAAAEAERLRTEQERYEAERAKIEGRQALQAIEDDQALTDSILENIGLIDQAQKTSTTKRAEHAEEEQDKVRGALLATMNAVASSSDQVTNLIIAHAEKGTEAQQQAALGFFRVNQAASAITAAINTYVAITEALKLGPVLGPIAAVGIGATGFAQEAAILSQSPPSFHTGGEITSSTGGRAPGLAPDERRITARVGEEVVTRQQRGADHRPIIVQMRYEHRGFGAFTADHMRHSNSPMRKAVAKASPRRLGHRSQR